MNNTAVLFDRVGFSYGRKNILRDFSFRAETGEKICLFGPSGCGKSTVLRLICGLEKPTAGTLSVHAKTVRPVFQEDRLLPFLTVAENVAMFSDRARADEILRRLDLADAADEYPRNLSGGMARRAALARALAQNGDLYVLDEPFNGLDDENTQNAIALIRERTAGKTVICVLHDADHAKRLGCRIVEMKPDESPVG